MRTESPAHVTAQADQYEAACATVAAMPWLSPVLVQDAAIERALLKTADWPWPFDGDLGHGFLRFRAERVREVPIEPGNDLRTALPGLSGATCDRCEIGNPSAAWVLLPLGPHVAALALCGDCVASLSDYSPVHFITEEQTHA